MNYQVLTGEKKAILFTVWALRGTYSTLDLSMKVAREFERQGFRVRVKTAQGQATFYSNR